MICVLYIYISYYIILIHFGTLFLPIQTLFRCDVLTPEPFFRSVKLTWWFPRSPFLDVGVNMVHLVRQSFNPEPFQDLRTSKTRSASICWIAWICLDCQILCRKRMRYAVLCRTLQNHAVHPEIVMHRFRLSQEALGKVVEPLRMQHTAPAFIPGQMWPGDLGIGRYWHHMRFQVDGAEFHMSCVHVSLGPSVCCRINEAFGPNRDEILGTWNGESEDWDLRVCFRIRDHQLSCLLMVRSRGLKQPISGMQSSKTTPWEIVGGYCGANVMFTIWVEKKI